MQQDFSVKSLCSKAAVQRLSPFFICPPPGRERVLRTGGKKHIRESARILDFGFWIPGLFFSENGSTRDVLFDDTAAIYYNSSNRYFLGNMSCARAIDDTAVNNL